ncbi:MAG TPA: hypothetical protein VFF36_15420, partial [Planctomycetota bacterium]|nr:hypothetical protein [Planctomycetota bacterium]
MSGPRSGAAAPPPARPPEWFDAQYNNRARVADAPQILATWADRSAAARAALACELDVACGPDPGERLD